MKTKVLQLGPFGMFGNVNEVICQLHMAEQNGYKFTIDWSRSPYKDNSLRGDPWRYFFEDCFDDADQDASEVLGLLGGSTDSNVNIMRPRLYENIPGGPILLPKDRRTPHRLIGKYLRIKPDIEHMISDYRANHLNGYTIGLHLRGPGRLDGGTKQLKRRHNLKNGVPFDLYFSHVDQRLGSHPEAKVFVCSDSQMVIDECKSKYGARITTYDATRSNFGEMHTENRGNLTKYSGYKLGVDVIAEAYLLSHTDYLVHGNSNVSNFVLCLNPSQESKYIYEDDPHGSLSLRLLNMLPVRSFRRVRRETIMRATKAARKTRALLAGS